MFAIVDPQRIVHFTVAAGVRSPMPGEWIRELTSADVAHAEGASDWRTRQDLGVLIGDNAVHWAVATARTVTDDIVSTVPRFRTDTLLRPTLSRAVEATTLGVLRGLATTDVTALWPCREAGDAVDYYVRSKVAIDDVLRSVLLGQKWITRRVFDSLHTHSERTPVREAEYVKDVLDDSFDHFTVGVAAQYERVRATADTPATLLKRVPGGTASPVETAARFGYGLSGTHVAMVLGSPQGSVTDDDAVSGELVAQLEQATSSSGVLAVTDLGDTHVWLRDPKLSLDDLHTTVAAVTGGPREALRVAVGLPGAGSDGFRLSHQQARATWRVAQLGDARLGRVLGYGSIETVSLLVSDLPRARSLVFRALGQLATDDARMRELRQTLRALLDAKGSVAKAGLALHAHRNTVTYRARQIDSLLGGNSSPLELRAALELAETVPAAVLIPPRSVRTRPPQQRGSR
jgi:hypothetical protein